MNLREYQTVFTVTIGVLSLVATFPTASMIVPFPLGKDRFSELWLLGPEHMAESYPFNIRVGEAQGPVYVGARNHMGYSQYYMIYVKFRNQTQPLPNATASQPSPLPPLYEYQFFLLDGEEWEKPLMFAIQNAQFNDRSVFIRDISINDAPFSVNCYSTLDSDNVGFYYQLFFELWLYDASSQGFRYHNRFVGIWLNVTG